MNAKELAIIGAGPFGLAAAAYASKIGIDFSIIGKPMGFWREQMPKGMFLRSGFDWHLDPYEEFTFSEYMKEKKLSEEASKPISLPLMLHYTEWFVEKRALSIEERYLSLLQHSNGLFHLHFSDGTQIASRNVLVAVGFTYFKHIPSELSSLIPKSCQGHSCDYSDLGCLRGKRCLIIGGRQSAFETAAILGESSKSPIYLSCRHDAPEMTESDWSFMKEIDQHVSQEPMWYWNLSTEKKEEYKQRAIEAARLRIEPWLKERVNKDHILLMPNTKMISCEPLSTGELEINFDNGKEILVDHVIFATGFRVDISKIPFLTPEVLQTVRSENGSPLLNDHFQSTLPGLSFTGPAAMAQFGYPVGFVRGCRTAARLAMSGYSLG